LYLPCHGPSDWSWAWPFFHHSGAHSLALEVDHVIIIRLHLLLGYSHLFERLPIEYVHWTPLVHQRFHDGELVNIDRYHHGVVIRRVDTLEIPIDDWGHSQSKRNGVHLMYCSQVLLPGIVGATTPNKSPSDGVDDLSATPSSFPSWRVLPSQSTLRSVVVFSRSLRGVVPPPYRLFPLWGPLRSLVPLHKLPKLLDLDKFLSLIFQCLPLLSGMSTDSMVPTSMG